MGDWKINNQKGASVLELILFVGLIFAVVLSFQMSFSKNDASIRDLHRLTAMRNTEVTFERLFQRTGSYAAAQGTGGCSVGAKLATCDFSKADVNAAEWSDPGDASYVVTTAPTATEYAVTFQLERSHGDLGAGEHILSQRGIH